MLDLQRKVDLYIKKNGKIPNGEAISEHFYRIAKLPQGKTQVQSPYSRVLLDIVIDDTGRIGIDYTPELLKAMNKSGLQLVDDAKLDLRTVLVKQAFFVPAWSFPYHWMDEQPTISQQ